MPFGVYVDNTAIVEVEENHPIGRLPQLPPETPGIPVAADIIDDNHAFVGNSSKQVISFTAVSSLSANPKEPYVATACNVSNADDVCFIASTDEILVISGFLSKDDGLRCLHEVGNTEKKLSFLLPGEPHSCGFCHSVEPLIGIIGIVLVDDISHERVSPGRLYAETPAMANPPHPNENLLNHKCKNNKSKEKSKEKE